VPGSYNYPAPAIAESPTAPMLAAAESQRPRGSALGRACPRPNSNQRHQPGPSTTPWTCPLVADTELCTLSVRGNECLFLVRLSHPDPITSSIARHCRSSNSISSTNRHCRPRCPSPTSTSRKSTGTRMALVHISSWSWPPIPRLRVLSKQFIVDTVFCHAEPKLCPRPFP
jgi:hypothetical protein